MKIINPINKAIKAASNTAPAARSFAFFIKLFFSGDIKSAKFSRAEFISSTTKTMAIEKMIAIHS